MCLYLLSQRLVWEFCTDGWTLWFSQGLADNSSFSGFSQIPSLTLLVPILVYRVNSRSFCFDAQIILSKYALFYNSFFRTRGGTTWFTGHLTFVFLFVYQKIFQHSITLKVISHLFISRQSENWVLGTFGLNQQFGRLAFN